jgi:hypothetical protein
MLSISISVSIVFDSTVYTDIALVAFVLQCSIAVTTATQAHLNSSLESQIKQNNIIQNKAYITHQILYSVRTMCSGDVFCILLASRVV